MSRSPFIIALDARSVHRGIRRGTGKNLRDLYRTVLELRPDWSVIGYHRGDDRLGLQSSSERYTPRRIEMRGDRFDAWLQGRLPLAAWRDGAHLLHCPANECAVWRTVPVLLTIHDLLPYTHGSASVRARFARTARLAARRRLTVIAPSRYTADQLIETFGLLDDQIVVNPWAPDTAMCRVDDPAELRRIAARYGVNRPYVLHFGAPDARKNTAELIRAWSTLPPSVRDDVQLLIVGLDDRTHRNQMAELIDRAGITHSVVLSGFAEENDVAGLLSGALLLAYPSRCEGFGLPILDAWIDQTPVLTADNSALIEVAGDGALLVDATSEQSIAEGLGRMLDQPRLRSALVDRGSRIVQTYTWRATAERFIEAAQRAAGLKEARHDAA